MVCRHLPPIKPDPRLLDKVSDPAFVKKIRKYNTALPFASMSAQVDQSLSQGGIDVYRIQGAVERSSAALLPPPDNNKPVKKRNSYAKVYMHDTQELPAVVKSASKTSTGIPY